MVVDKTTKQFSEEIGAYLKPSGFQPGPKGMNSSTLGVAGKQENERTLVSALPIKNIDKILETKVKSSTLKYEDGGQVIEHRAKPKMTETADLRKVEDRENRTQLGQKD